MITRSLLLGCASAAMLAMAADASAADKPSSDSMTDPQIGPAHNQQGAAAVTQNRIVVVTEDGDYAYALPTDLALPFHIEAEVTNNKWRVKDSFIVIGIAPLNSGGQIGSCCGSLLDFDQYNYATMVPHGATKHVDIDGIWRAEVNGNSIATRARNACRNLRKELSNQGMKHDEIFSQDRPTTLPTEFRYVARVGHRYDNWDLVEATSASIAWKQSQPSYANIQVTCQKAPSQVVGDPNPDPTPIPTGSDSLAAKFQVNQAALAITPKQYEAKCPAKLHLNPTIEATGKGTVKYRFVNELGQKSQTFQVKFDKSEVKFLDHVIEIDGKGKPKGLGFKAAQAQGGALGLAAPTDPNLKQGYFQVEVLSPHKKLSNIADYSVKCTVTTAGNDELAAEPGIVKPVIGTLTLGLADLVIEQIQPSPAVPTKLFVKVTNKGNVASTPTNLKAIRWTGNQAKARGTMVPALQPGQSEVILAELGGTFEGATQLYMRIDDPNRIKELNEGNNSFKAK